MRTLTHAAVVCSCAVFLSACADEEPLSSAPVTSGLSTDISGPRGPIPWTIDDEFARVAREEVPGFAGRYLDGDRHVALITDPASTELAREYIARYRAGRG